MAEAEILLALDRCRDAVHDDTMWTEALDHLAWSMGADGCSFVNQAPPQLRSRLPASSVYADFIRDFVGEGWAEQDHRARRGWPKLRGGGKVLLEHDVSTQEERETLPVYRGLYARHDLYWWASVSFLTNKNLWALSFLRSQSKGPFTASDGTRMGRLVPHLCRLVASRLSTLKTRAEDLVRVLEAAAGPALVVSEDLRIVAIGPRAYELLGVNSSVVSTAAQAIFRDATPSLAARLLQSDGAEPMVIHRRDARPLIIDVIPHDIGNSRSFVGAHSVLVLKDLQAVGRVGPRRLRSIFGLTPAEAALSELLVAGQTTHQAADTLGIAHETARNQLKAIFAKTTTNRQADLVSLLLRTALHDG